MRELTMDSAADLGAVRQRRAPAKAKRKRSPAEAARWRVLRARVFTGVVWGGFALLMGGVVLNAAFNQKGRHPAPILGASEPAPIAAPRPVARIVPVPAAKAPAPAAADPAPQDEDANSTGSVANDGIGSMLDGHGAAPKPAHAKAARPLQLHTATIAKPAAPARAHNADRSRLTSLFSAAAKGP